MQKIYFKNFNGKKEFVEVGDEIAQVYKLCRQEEWKANFKERYYCTKSLDNLSEQDEKFLAFGNPEAILIARDIRIERRKEIVFILKTLKKEQITLIKMLLKGMSLDEIANELGVSRPAISQQRQTLQKKFKKFL